MDVNVVDGAQVPDCLDFKYREWLRTVSEAHLLRNIGNDLVAEANQSLLYYLRVYGLLEKRYEKMPDQEIEDLVEPPAAPRDAQREVYRPRRPRLLGGPFELPELVEIWDRRLNALVAEATRVMWDTAFWVRTLRLNIAFYNAQGERISAEIKCIDFFDQFNGIMESD